MASGQVLDHPGSMFCVWCTYLGGGLRPFLSLLQGTGLSAAAAHVAAAELRDRVFDCVKDHVVTRMYTIRPVPSRGPGNPRTFSTVPDRIQIGGVWAHYDVAVPVDWALSVAASVLGESCLSSSEIPVDRFFWAGLWFGPYWDRVGLRGDIELSMSHWSGPLDESNFSIRRGMPVEEVLVSVVLWNMRDDPVIRRWMGDVPVTSFCLAKRAIAERVVASGCAALSEAAARVREEIELELVCR